MYSYEYLLLQKRLESLLKTLHEWKRPSEHIRTIDEINIINFKIKNLKFVNN